MTRDELSLIKNCLDRLYNYEYHYELLGPLNRTMKALTIVERDLSLKDLDMNRNEK